MKSFRASALVVIALPLAALSIPAFAQVNDDVVLNIMRQCARIDDPTARLACYDNNIRSAGSTVRSSVPGEMGTPQGGRGLGISGSSAPLASGGAQGFGREDIVTPDRFETPAGELDELTARVASVEQRQPGYYVITLEDGARWVFSEAVSRSYRAPRSGSTITIDRGSLGSFLMSFDNQSSVSVRRER